MIINIIELTIIMQFVFYSINYSKKRTNVIIPKNTHYFKQWKQKYA